MLQSIMAIYLLFLLTLTASCGQGLSTEQGPNTTRGATTATADTLAFTSGIKSIFEDSKGHYWFGSLKEGVARYDGQSLVYFDRQDGMTDNQIWSIQEDRAGVIWFSTQDGVSTYDGKAIKNRTSAAAVIPEADWMKFGNDLWFAAGIKSGVLRYDGMQLTYLPFPAHQVLNTSDNLSAVTDLSTGKNNMIWIATYAGVWGYNGRDFKVINDKTLGFDRRVAPLHIRSILEDSKGRLWMGNNGIGVLVKEGDSIYNFSEKQQLVHAGSKKRGDKSPPGTLEHVFVIAEDAKGHIWFGDRDAGLWKFDGTSMVNYTVKDGLTNEFALSIYKDKQGKMWFGMVDGKLYTFNGTRFERQF